MMIITGVEYVTRIPQPPSIGCQSSSVPYFTLNLLTLIWHNGDRASGVSEETMTLAIPRKPMLGP